MTTFAQITVKTVVGAGLCVTAVALSPHAAALQLKTGGYKCADAAAGAAPVAGMPLCAAPAVEAMGIAPPLAPPVAAVPPVPLAPPPVAVPPVPLAPPVPVVPVPAAPVVPAAAAPAAAPVAVAAGAATGKGVPTVSPGGGPVAGTPTLPGPADEAAIG
ncbi:MULTISPECIES: hypothetical protein [unclassified Mycolicibacterium]|uniref:hypothetical protein n=1 Tax=unclassified Mycolicibacterium TaxID=2636767 RepID=UPI0012DBF5EC|nr:MULTISPECIES: hypothetical protein [unclassified Mycolicibacterium]MUL82995.1 hypothetical protein [Mycolicibacterium sp. CBMA 329]MUL89330.1 hypothetical protein [Mycolicibacterium sp. CBMA 331]MUL99019.1 hypothetical protein [Mycolicibacterium sp. CBMA 334]MUM38846.1 hypothetical protein [Mycolicibacterium sp. CBMA 247]MUM45394.1 hypothetical protein [Mycolicibacterium sp. CBMA 294]